jgi:uncharacterized protein YggE
MRNLLHSLLLLCFSSTTLFAQQAKLLEQPHLETVATFDTLVPPNQIYLHIGLAEYDTKDKIQIETLEQKMEKVFETLQIDVVKQLKVLDISSNFKRYFLTNKKILKAKSYELLVYDATTAMQVVQLLEMEKISNVKVHNLKHSEMDAIKRTAKSRATQAAKLNAEAMLQPLNQKIKSVLYVTDSESSFYNNDYDKITINQIPLKSSEYRDFFDIEDEGGFDIKNEDIKFLELKVTMEVKVIFAIEPSN